MKNMCKNLIFLIGVLTLWIFVTGSCYCQEYFYSDQLPEVITDSIVWRLVGVDNGGDSTCTHNWVYGPENDANPGQYCCVYHNGYHCSWRDQVRSQICRKCLRKETYRERWYQHRPEPEKTEYEKLEEKINPESIDMKDSIDWLPEFYSPYKKGCIYTDTIFMSMDSTTFK